MSKELGPVPGLVLLGVLGLLVVYGYASLTPEMKEVFCNGFWLIVGVGVLGTLSAATGARR